MQTRIGFWGFDQHLLGIVRLNRVVATYKLACDALSDGALEKHWVVAGVEHRDPRL